MKERSKILEQIRQQSYKARADALREAAQNRHMNTSLVAHGASGGGGGSLCNTKTNGLSVFASVQLDSIMNTILPYEYTPDKGMDMYTFVLGEGLVQSVVWYDEEQKVWMWIFELGFPSESYAYSETLVSAVWIPVGELSIIPNESICGTELRDEYPYYCGVSSELGVAQLMPIWSGSVGVGDPGAWGGPSIILIWNGEYWQTEDGDLLPGGTVSTLPIGTFNISKGQTFTISEGLC